MNIDQDVLDNYHDNTFEIPSDLRSKFIAALEKKAPGADFAALREDAYVYYLGRDRVKLGAPQPTVISRKRDFILRGGSAITAS